MRNLRVGVYYLCSANLLIFLVPGAQCQVTAKSGCSSPFVPSNYQPIFVSHLLLPHMEDWSQLILKINQSAPFDKELYHHPWLPGPSLGA